MCSESIALFGTCAMTYWDFNEMVDILQLTFSNTLSLKIFFHFDFPKDRIGPVTDLVPIRQKDIRLNNGYTVHVPIYAQPMHIMA